jgi:UDP-2,3-diacylglucosamine pyrophosphatase LpxH
VRTLVVSDLHLASRTDADVLRHPPAREPLYAALRDVDRLVLLGDVLELRHGPVIDALETARPVFEGIGAALRDDAEVVLVAGNHDHALVAPWLERRSLDREPALRLEQRAGARASEATAMIGAWIGGDRLDVAYPGLWLRSDVYATHGHYLDRHVTVPTIERLAAGMMARLVGSPPEAAAAPEDYEAALAPTYAWLHVIARYSGGFGTDRQRGTQRAWKVLRAKGPRPVRHRAFAAAFPLLVRVVNRAGLGPVGADVSPTELRRAGVAAMGETCRRLGIDAEWVIFGHTHRTGPRPDHDAPEEWRAPTGSRLMNTGSWVHEGVFLGTAGKRSPYWPGTVVELDDDGPPRLRNLLEGYSMVEGA